MSNKKRHSIVVCIALFWSIKDMFLGSFLYCIKLSNKWKHVSFLKIINLNLFYTDYRKNDNIGSSRTLQNLLKTIEISITVNIYTTIDILGAVFITNMIYAKSVICCSTFLLTLCKKLQSTIEMSIGTDILIVIDILVTIYRN